MTWEKGNERFISCQSRVHRSKKLTIKHTNLPVPIQKMRMDTSTTFRGIMLELASKNSRSRKFPNSVDVVDGRYWLLLLLHYFPVFHQTADELASKNSRSRKFPNLVDVVDGRYWLLLLLQYFPVFHQTADSSQVYHSQW